MTKTTETTETKTTETAEEAKARAIAFLEAWANGPDFD